MREAEHGLNLYEIGRRSGMTLTEVRKVVRQMQKYMHLIRQDQRSIEAGHTWNDGQAVYYSEKKYRDAIDYVRINWPNSKEM